MYLYQPLGHSNFGDNPIVALVLGIVQHASYVVGIGVKTHATKKYETETKRTQRMTHKAQLELKKEEAKSQKKLLLMKGQTALYSDVRLKKLVIISIVTVIAIVVIGLGAYITLSVGGNDE